MKSEAAELVSGQSPIRSKARLVFRRQWSEAITFDFFFFFSRSLVEFACSKNFFSQLQETMMAAQPITFSNEADISTTSGAAVTTVNIVLDRM